jgi:tetratricopeptide (TPR) repeat protein
MPFETYYPPDPADSAPSTDRRFLRQTLAFGLGGWLLVMGIRFFWRLREGQWLTLLSEKEIPSFAMQQLKLWAFTRFAGTTFLAGTGVALCIHWGARLLGAKRTFIPFWIAYLLAMAAFGLASDLLPSGNTAVWTALLAKGLTILYLISRFYRLSVGQTLGTAVLAGTLLGAALVPYLLSKSVASLWKQSWSSLLKTDSLSRVDRAVDPDYTLRTLDGKTVQVGDLQGKVVFINFWATWCLPCRIEMPSLRTLYDRFSRNPNVVFLFVSDEEASVLRRYEKETRYQLPYFISTSARPEAFESRGIPATFIVSREGRVVAMREGAARWDTDSNVRLLEQLAATGPGRPLPKELEQLPLIQETVPEPDPTAAALHDEAADLMKEGKYFQAQKALDKAFVIRERSGHQDMEMAATLYALGNAHYHQRQWAVAEAYYKQALLLAQRLQKPDDPDLGNYYNALGCAYYSQNRLMEALVLHEKAIEVARHDKKSKDPLILFLSNAAKDLMKLGRTDEAKAMEQEIKRIKKQLVDISRPV